MQIISLCLRVFGFIFMHVSYENLRGMEVNFEKLEHSCGQNSLTTLAMHLNPTLDINRLCLPL